MTDINSMKPEHIKSYATSLQKQVVSQRNKISELQKTISKLQDNDTPHPDTPSLPVIRFREEVGQTLPFCEKHGSMNRYENHIWRCIACGVAIEYQSPETR